MIDKISHLLLVEQDTLLAEITAFRLELLGYRVTCLHRGADLLRQVHEERPDLILLDTVLPDLDGIDVINRLNIDSQTSAIPILVMSTEADLNTVERAFAAGADGYLVIPYDPLILEEKIEALLAPAMAR